MKLKRMTAALLLLAMLLSCLPLGVLAADAEPVEAENTVDAAPAEEIVTEEAEISTRRSTQADTSIFPPKRQISCSLRRHGSPLRMGRPSAKR